MREVLNVDARAELNRLGLEEHLTSQRSNGLRSMVKRIQELAGSVREIKTPSEFEFSNGPWPCRPDVRSCIRIVHSCHARLHEDWTFCSIAGIAVRKQMEPR